MPSSRCGRSPASGPRRPSPRTERWALPGSRGGIRPQPGSLLFSVPKTKTMTRLAFGMLAYAFSAIMVGTTLPTPMYALYGEQMHFAVLTTTVIYATYAGGVLFALLAFGRSSDAIGRRPVLLAGVVFAVASAAAFLVAHSVSMLLVGRVLSGLSAGIFTGTATAAVIEAAPENWRTRAAAVATVANMGGLGLGPLLAGVLVEYAPAPLHLSFIVHIVLALLAGVAVLVVPETSACAGKIGVQRLSVPAEVRAVFVVASLAAFAGFAVTGLFAAVAPSFVSQVVGIGNHAIARLIASSIFFTSAVAKNAHRSLRRGLAAVVERTPADRRGEVSCTYFLVAYVAISLPVVGDGVAAQHWG